MPGTLVVAAQGSDEAKTVTLTARNGVVHWTASTGPYVTIDGPTGGTLPPGRSITLRVTADKATACTQATPVEQASVTFTPSGAVALSWTC